MKEHQHVEWEESWRDEWLKWICGFANAEGGVLVIGRNDQGAVVGVPQARKLLEDIPNKVRDVLGIMVDVNLREQNGKDYLEIRVEPYPSPISYKGEYYYRSGSTKQELKGTALERFLLKKRGRHWDDVPEPSFTVRSCSPAAIRLFKQRATESGRMDRSLRRDSREVLLGNLELTEKHGLKRAACLLFSGRPEKYVSGAWIKIGFFMTDDDLRYQDEVHGSLFEQVEKTLELLHAKYLKAYISYQGLHRRETFLFPYEALREALLNAVVHKDYASGIPIQISVYDDRSFSGIRASCRRTGRWKSCWASIRRSPTIRCWPMHSFERAISRPGDAASRRSRGVSGTRHRPAGVRLRHGGPDAHVSCEPRPRASHNGDD